MYLLSESKFPILRFMTAGVWISVCLFIIAAPLLASRGHYAPSSILYLVFSGVCHQMPERSFEFAGFSFAVCHRCFGIYLGLAIGSLINIPFNTPAVRRIWVAAAILPLLFDAALPLIGIGSSRPASRTVTGLLFGAMLSSLFILGIGELTANAPRRRMHCKGEAR